MIINHLSPEYQKVLDKLEVKNGSDADKSKRKYGQSSKRD